MRYLAIFLLCVAPALEARADESPAAGTASFVAAALRDVGAEAVRCPREVREAVRSRQMVAVCARFDGDFEAFSARWPERPRSSSQAGAASIGLPEATPQTHWEHRNGTYERIYAVAGAALGVRFTRGELLLVYPE